MISRSRFKKVLTGALESARSLEGKIKKKGGKELVGMALNLVDLVWGADKPKRPTNPVLVLDKKYAGEDFPTKIENIRKDLKTKKSHGLILSGLDEIMWLFNIRGMKL